MKQLQRKVKVARRGCEDENGEKKKVLTKSNVVNFNKKKGKRENPISQTQWKRKCWKTAHTTYQANWNAHMGI